MTPNPGTFEEWRARKRLAGPPTDTDVSHTRDGRPLDSREAVMAWLAEVSLARQRALAARRTADAEAVASLRLEGLTPDVDSDAEIAAWIRGDLSSAEVVEGIFQRFSGSRTSRPCPGEEPPN
ncbi:MAG: hypothetical protein ACRDVC_01810 [Acidimicrobiales bacterium]